MEKEQIRKVAEKLADEFLSKRLLNVGYINPTPELKCVPSDYGAHVSCPNCGMDFQIDKHDHCPCCESPFAVMVLFKPCKLEAEEILIKRERIIKRNKALLEYDDLIEGDYPDTPFKGMQSI